MNTIHLKTVHMKAWRWLVPGCLLIVAACSDEQTTVPPPAAPDAEHVTREAWVDFEAGDLTSALAGFDRAVVLDADYADAQVGRGWCLLRGADGSGPLANAEAAFTTAATLEPTNPDALAGRAGARLGLGAGEFAGAIADAEAALALDPDYAFTHVPAYTATALRLIDAQARVAQGDFAAALTALDVVFPSNLDADNPDTWVVEGHIEASFETAVLAYLNRVNALWRVDML
ncbi:MAG: hypothetical protein IPH86_14670 [bacterium]|nr:hypothetical protein [bacterium]